MLIRNWKTKCYSVNTTAIFFSTFVKVGIKNENNYKKRIISVSYTHLDVYKRQILQGKLLGKRELAIENIMAEKFKDLVWHEYN